MGTICYGKKRVFNRNAFFKKFLETNKKHTHVKTKSTHEGVDGARDAPPVRESRAERERRGERVDVAPDGFRGFR